MKKLDQWLEEKGISQDDFGKALLPPVTQGQISHYITGHTPIPLVTAMQIEALTDGEVTFDDWKDALLVKNEIPDARTLKRRLQQATRVPAAIAR